MGPSMDKEMVLASANPGKLRELRNLIGPYGLILYSTRDFPDIPGIEETGETFEENALKKAATVYRYTGMPALADDSGLKVDALDGRPGVYSSRYAGDQVTDRDNVHKLLEALQYVPDPERTACFVTVLVLVRPDEPPHYFEGRCQGMIVRSPRGEQGFGYDPVFVPEGYSRTFAELPSREKNRISHRARAMEQFRTFVEARTHD